MSEVALAFLWHQHQPYYPDDLTGIKDDYGMALHLLEVPEMRCSIRKPMQTGNGTLPANRSMRPARLRSASSASPDFERVMWDV